MYCFIVLFSMLYTIAYSGVLEKKHLLSKHQTQNLIHKLRLRLDELEKDAKAICGLLDGHYSYQEKGYVAGAKYLSGKGSAANNYLCIPEVPEWGEYKDGYQNYQEMIYATEFEMDADHNVAGKTKCPKGWHREYRGYLMSQYSLYSLSHFICVDAFPDIAPNGSGNFNVRLLQAVEVVCEGAIKCSPYADGRETACIVCTS